MRPQIPALTGLRAVAAYAVLLAHALDYSGLHGRSVTNLGLFAMSLFFTLSGFVMQYNYGQRFADDGILAASKFFLLARFARLYPLYIVGLILSVSFIPDTPFFHNWLVAISCLTLTQTWFNVPGVVGDTIGPAWSISTEFGLYLLFIPVAAAISRAHRPRIILTAICVSAVATVALIVAAYPNYLSVMLAPIQTLGPHDSAPPWYWLLYLSPFIRGFEFFAGALVANIVLTETSRRTDRLAVRRSDSDRVALRPAIRRDTFPKL
jgi:peptidoglycan/LPS O-acetylase OafA/YrhL